MSAASPLERSVRAQDRYCETCIYFEWDEFVGAKGRCTWGKRITKKQVTGNPYKYEYRRKCELFDAL